MTKRWTDKSGFQWERAGEGDTNTWLTPPELVKRLGKFDLDPCAAVNQPWKLAKKSYTEKEDGLVQVWKGRVFCNPPYGRHVGTWLDKASKHGDAIVLIFSRTSTIWFKKYVWKTASSVLFVHDRLSFHTIDGKVSAGKPAANILVAWGKENDKALLNCEIPGLFIEAKHFHHITGKKIN